MLLSLFKRRLQLSKRHQILLLIGQLLRLEGKALCTVRRAHPELTRASFDHVLAVPGRLGKFDSLIAHCRVKHFSWALNVLIGVAAHHLLLRGEFATEGFPQIRLEGRFFFGVPLRRKLRV